MWKWSKCTKTQLQEKTRTFETPAAWHALIRFLLPWPQGVNSTLMPRLLVKPNSKGHSQHRQTHTSFTSTHTHQYAYHIYTCIFRKAHGEPCSSCPPPTHSNHATASPHTHQHNQAHCTTFTAFYHFSYTDRQEANVSFIRACFQSVLMMNISDLPMLLLNILRQRPLMKLYCH